MEGVTNVPVSYRPLFDEGEFRPRVTRRGSGSQSKGAAALEGAGEGMSQLGEFYMKKHANEEQKRKQDMFELGKTTQQDIQSKPEEALQTIHSANSNPMNGGQTFDEMLPAPDVRLGPLSNDIAKAKTPLDLPDIGARASRALTGKEAAPGFGVTSYSGGEPDESENPSLPSTQYGPTSAPPIAKLLAQAQARKAAQDQEIQAQLQEATNKAKGMAYGTTSGQLQAKNENFPTELSQKSDEAWTQEPIDVEKARATHQNATDIDLSPETTQGKAKQEAEITRQKLPVLREEEQMRANIQRQTHQLDRLFDLDHAAPTGQVRNRMSSAKDALNLIGQNEQLLDAMDKQGMMGPLKSRMAKMATGDVKSVGLVKALFGDTSTPAGSQSSIDAASGLAQETFPNEPQKAQLAAQYFAQMSYLQSLAAMVHGGQRGASSPNMLARFEKIIGSTGDTPIVKSELVAIRNLMNIYAKNGEAPDLLAIPDAAPSPTGLLRPGELGPMLPQTPAQSAAQKLELLRKRSGGR